MFSSTGFVTRSRRAPAGLSPSTVQEERVSSSAAESPRTPTRPIEINPASPANMVFVPGTHNLTSTTGIIPSTFPGQMRQSVLNPTAMEFVPSSSIGHHVVPGPEGIVPRRTGPKPPSPELEVLVDLATLTQRLLDPPAEARHADGSATISIDWVVQVVGTQQFVWNQTTRRPQLTHQSLLRARGWEGLPSEYFKWIRGDQQDTVSWYKEFCLSASLVKD